MAVDVAAPTTRAFARARLLAVPARLALGAVVGVSFALRSLLSLLHVNPYYLPDEYLYPALARSIATTGRPLIRGGESHFPALLQPILTAPFQLFDDPQVAYRLTQFFGALTMSLAAIPVYLLARRLRLSEWYALACAALAVATPSMLYSGFMLADPIAYPLALTAVYTAVCALDAPTRRTQLVFMAWSALTVFARTQYVVLPVVFVLAAVALERHRALRTYRVTFAALAVAALAGLAIGPARVAGVYSGATEAHLALGTAAAWAGRNVLLLAYSAGWVLVPGALVGLVTTRTRVERAYAWLFVFLTAALVAEAAVIAGLDTDRFQERYLIAVVPLLAPAFGLYLRRGAPGRRAVALLAAAMIIFSVRVPLTGYVAPHTKDDSTFLLGVHQAERAFGVAGGGLVFAAAAGLLSLVAVALAFRPRRAAPVALALTLLAFGGVSTGAYAFDHWNAPRVQANSLPSDPSWVDHSGLRDVALLMPPSSEAQRTWHQLFWNRSIADVLLLKMKRLDGYSATRVRIADDGRILVRGRALRRPLLVQTYGSRASFTGAVRVADGKAFELWKPAGVPRFSMLAEGWYEDGWLTFRPSVTVWPDASGRVDGTLTLRLGVPVGAERTPLTFRAPGYRRTVVLEPGVARTIRIPADRRGRWTLKLSTPHAEYIGLRSVSVRALSPVFTRRGGARVTCAAPGGTFV